MWGAGGGFWAEYKNNTLNYKEKMINHNRNKNKDFGCDHQTL